MIRLLKIIFFSLCTLLLMNCSRENSVLHDVQGNEITASQLKGKWIILNYWADWCDSCIEEIPELNRFYQHNQNKNIVLLGINYDRMPSAELKKAIHQMHIAFPVIVEDPAQTWALSSFDVLPATFIIDPNGHMVKRILGGNTEKSISATLHQLQKNSA